MTGKPKMYEGVLCRDEKQTVAFFGAELFEFSRHVGPSRWRWVTAEREWTLKQWKAEYDLALPRPGKSFLVEIEL